MTRFIYSQVYSLETDFTEPCSEHALIREEGGKMGRELLLVLLGLLALAHGEIFGYNCLTQALFSSSAVSSFGSVMEAGLSQRKNYFLYKKLADTSDHPLTPPPRLMLDY